MHQREPVLARRLNQASDTGDVDCPCLASAIFGLRGVDLVYAAALITLPYGPKSNAASDAGSGQSSVARLTGTAGIALISARPSCPPAPMIKVCFGSSGLTSSRRGCVLSAWDSSA